MKVFIATSLLSTALLMSVSAYAANPSQGSDTLKADNAEQKIGLLLPAVQAAREAARRDAPKPRAHRRQQPISLTPRLGKTKP